MKEAIRYVKDILNRMENDECNDEQIGYILGRVNAENKGYFKQDSYVNYDEAMRMVGIGNRNKLIEMLSKHGVEMQKINNTPVGFLRSEVESVATQQPQSKRKRKILS